MVHEMMHARSTMDLWTLLHWWESKTEELVLNNSTDQCDLEWMMRDYWRNVMESLEWRPEQANVIQYGKYPLQRYVCRDYEDDVRLASLLSPPVEVYQELINLSPNSLRVLDDHHSTILDNLCIFYSKFPDCADILPLVHEAYPQAIDLYNCDKNLPLHSFILSSAITTICLPHQNFMLRYLISQTPIEFIHSKNQFSHTPLDCLCYELNQIDLSSTTSSSSLSNHQPQSQQPQPHNILSFIQTHQTNHDDDDDDDIINDNQSLQHHQENDSFLEQQQQTPHQIENWKYVLSLISFATTILIKNNHHPDIDYILPELHSAIYMQCPLIFIQIILSLYPEQLNIREPNIHNYTPLEMIVTSHYITISNHNNKYRNKQDVCSRAIHQGSKRQMFQFLLQQQQPTIEEEDSYSSMLQQQSMYGSLLTKSLKFGNILYLDDAIDLLIGLAPTALSIPILQFYPFQIAAFMGRKNDDDNDDENKMQYLETIYHLLREVPWVMEHFIPPE